MKTSLPRRFVILSTQRSGSNWLEDRLASHPHVTMYREEVFRPTLDKPTAYQRYRRSNLGRRALAAIAPPIAKVNYLRWLQDSAPQDAPVVAFRLMYDQLRRNPSLGAILATSRTPIIHLVRDNVLETHVSVVGARQTGLYVTRSSEKKTPAVVVEVGGLVQALDRRRALIDRHRRLLRLMPHLEIGYRSIASDPYTIDEAILRFLRLESVALESTIQRSGDRPLRERIANISEVQGVLRPTGLADLLD